MRSFNPSQMRYAVCYRNAMGAMTALVCTCTIGIAREIASWMVHTCLRDSHVLTGKKTPVLYVFDVEGHNYGSFETEE